MKKNIYKKKKSKRNGEKIGVRLLAASLAAAMVAGTAAYGLMQYSRPTESVAMERDSFSGIKDVVEEHSKENPFVILDITPGEGYAVSGKLGPFSLGTMGYLVEGQAPIEQDLKRHFQPRMPFQKYWDREEFVVGVINSYADGFPNFKYEEAYGNLGDGFTGAGWMCLYEDGDENKDVTGFLEEATVFEVKGLSPEDSKEGYNFNYVSGTLPTAQASAASGTFSYAGTGGQYSVQFGNPDMRLSGYQVGSYDTNWRGYSDSTDVYRVVDGKFVYVGTVGGQKAYEDSLGGGTTEEPTGPAPEETPSPPAEEIPNPPAEGTPNPPAEETPNPPAEETPNPPAEETPSPPAEETPNPPAEETPNTASDDNLSASLGWRKLVSGDGTPEGGGTPEGDGNGSGEGSGGEGGNGSGEGEGGGSGSDEGEGDGNGSGEEGGSGNSEEGGSGEGDGSGSGEGEGGGSGNSEEGAPEGSTPTGGGNWAEDQLYIVIFEYVELTEAAELYESGEYALLTGEESTATTYDMAASPVANGVSPLNAISLYDTSGGSQADVSFTYAGEGQGQYKIIPGKPADGVSAGGTVIQKVELQNVPVYFRCCSGSNWLEKFVFHSLKNDDNESSDFDVRVETKRADTVTPEDIANADLIYLESGKSSYLSLSTLKYIGSDEIDDMNESAASYLLYRAVEELLPVIVDYDIVVASDSGAGGSADGTGGAGAGGVGDGSGDSPNYDGTNYQYLAKALLKKDLEGFYAAMDEKQDGNFFDNIKIYLDSVVEDGTEEFPDKKDNDYHYVNRNVYVYNKEPDTADLLVSADFATPFNTDVVQRGFSEVKAMILAENAAASGGNQLTETVSRAKAIQYIINYSKGLVGDFKNLKVLEIQPSANDVTDIVTKKDDKTHSTVVIYQPNQNKAGAQILRSSKEITVDTVTKSVVEFNGEWEDINSTYDMIFLGLDGQKLNLGGDSSRLPVYNDGGLNDRAYHKGDVAVSDLRYDANDITTQKMEILRDYLAAGYPIVVEDNFFVDKTAKGWTAEDFERGGAVNTKYVQKDCTLYYFLREAVLGDYKDSIYTISDVHSSLYGVLFIMQLNINRPKLFAVSESNELIDAKTPQTSYAVQQEDGAWLGTVPYRVTGDRVTDGVWDAYKNPYEVHLYIDLDFDGKFDELEEIGSGEYVNDGGKIEFKIAGMDNGLVSWKLEARDVNNRYRRDSITGYTVLGGAQKEIKVLQIMGNPKEETVTNLQGITTDIRNSLLGYYLKAAPQAELKIETLSPDQLGEKLDAAKGGSGLYLNNWDVLVCNVDPSAYAAERGGLITDALRRYVEEGRSLLVTYNALNGNRNVLTDELLGVKSVQEGTGSESGYTYVSLGMASGLDKKRYANLSSGMSEPQGGLLAEQVNEGSISHFPYEINARYFGFGSGTRLRAAERLLNFDDNIKTESGKAYVTAWYTLGSPKLSSAEYQTAYNVSPKDARNNYYCYSKGNVIYIGQDYYPYTYEPGEDDRGIPDTSAEGVQECKFFVNALIASYYAGLHNSRVAIVAGFPADSAEIESISIPYDDEIRLMEAEYGGETGGILDNTVDVYFKFSDANLALSKNVKVALYYEDPAGEEVDIGTGIVKAKPFDSPLEMVVNNRLVPADLNNLKMNQIYRFKAPVIGLRNTLRSNGAATHADIYVVVTSEFNKLNAAKKIISSDRISLNRSELFLLE